MPKDILDAPLSNKTIKVRYPFFTMVEYAIIILDLLVVLVGVGTCWYFAFSDLTTYWLFLINPVVFILFFGLPPIWYILAWRKQSIALEASQDIEQFEMKEWGCTGFVQFIGGVVVVCMLFAALVGYSSGGLEFSSSFVVAILVFVIICPLQTFYIRYINKVVREINAQKETTNQ